MSAEVLHSALGVPQFVQQHYAKDTIRPANARTLSAPIEGKRIDAAVTVKRPEAKHPAKLKFDKQPVYQVDMRALATKSFQPVLKKTTKPRPKTAEPGKSAADLIKQANPPKKDTMIGKSRQVKPKNLIRKAKSTAPSPKKPTEPIQETKPEKIKIPIEHIIKKTLAEEKLQKLQAKTEAERTRLEEEAKLLKLKDFAEYTRENNAYTKMVPFKPKLAWGADERRLEVKEDERLREEAKAERERVKQSREKVQALGRERIGLAAYLEIVQEHNPGWRPKSASIEPTVKPSQPRKDRSPDIQHFILSQKRQRKIKAAEEQKLKEKNELDRIRQLKDLQEASRKVAYKPKPTKTPTAPKTKPKPMLVKKARIDITNPVKRLADLSVSAISGNDSQIQVQALSIPASPISRDYREPHSVEIQADCQIFDDVVFKPKAMQGKQSVQPPEKSLRPKETAQPTKNRRETNLLIRPNDNRREAKELARSTEIRREAKGPVKPTDNKSKAKEPVRSSENRSETNESIRLPEDKHDVSAQDLSDSHIDEHIRGMMPPVQALSVRQDPYGAWNPSSITLGEELTVRHLATEAKLKQEREARIEAVKEKYVSIKERIEAGVPSLQNAESEASLEIIEKPTHSQLLAKETVISRPPPTDEEVKEAVFRKLDRGPTDHALDDSLGFIIPGVLRLEDDSKPVKPELEAQKEPPELQTIMSSYRFGESMIPRDFRFQATGSISEMISGTKSFQHSIKESIIESRLPAAQLKKNAPQPKQLHSDEFSTEDEFSVVGLLVKDFFTTPPEDSIQDYSEEFDDESDAVSESVTESVYESSSKLAHSISESSKLAHSISESSKLARTPSESSKYGQSISESVISASRKFGKSLSRKEISEELSGKKSSGTIQEDIEARQSYEEDFESVSESLAHSVKRSNSYDYDFESVSAGSPVKASASISSMKRSGRRPSRPETPKHNANLDQRLVEVLAREHKAQNEVQMKAFLENLATVQDRSQAAFKEMMQQMMSFCSSLASNLRHSVPPRSNSPARNFSPERNLAPITPDRRIITHKKLTSDDSIHTLYSDDFEPLESVESLRSSPDLLRRRKEADARLKKSQSKESIVYSDSEKSLSYHPPSPPPKPEIGQTLKLSESAVSISEDFDLHNTVTEEIKASIEQTDQFIKTLDEYSDDFDESSVKFSESKKTLDKNSISSSLHNPTESGDYSEDFESVGESQSLYRSEDFDKLRIRPVPSIPEIEHSEQSSEQRESPDETSEDRSESKADLEDNSKEDPADSEVSESSEALSEEIYEDDFDNESLADSIPKTSRDIFRDSRDSQPSALRSSLEEDVEASSSSQVEWVIDLEPRSIDPEKQPVVDEASAEFEHTLSEVEEEPGAFRHDLDRSEEASESRSLPDDNNQVLMEDLWAKLFQEEVDLCLRLLQGSFEEQKQSSENKESGDKKELNLMMRRLMQDDEVSARLVTPVQLDPLDVLHRLHNDEDFYFERPRLLSDNLFSEINQALSPNAFVDEASRRAIYDAIDEAALRNMPGGLMLHPQPWSTRTIPAKGESSYGLEDAGARITKTITQWTETRLGIMPGEGYILADGKIDETKLDKDRELRKEQVVNQEILEENALWIEYEMPDAQTRLDIADKVFWQMIQEAVEILSL